MIRPRPHAGRHARNLGWLLTADAFNKGLSVFYFAYLSYALTLEEHGWYVNYLSFFPIFMVLASAGFPDVLTRDLAREPDRVGALLPAALLLQTGLGVAVAIAAYGLTLVLDYGPGLRQAVLWAVPAACIWAWINAHAAVMAAHERFKPVGQINMASRALAIGGSVAILEADYGVVAILTYLVPVYGLHLIVLALAVRQVRHPSTWTLQWTQMAYLVREGSSMLFGRAAATTYYRVDVPLLNPPLGAPGAAEFYGLGTRAFILLTTLPDTLETLFLPILSRRSSGPAEGQRDAALRFLKYMLILGLPVGVGVTVTGPALVAVLGERWTPAVPAVIVLTWVLVLVMIDRVVLVLARVQGRQHLITACHGPAVILKGVLALAIIPRYGMTGLLVLTLLISIGVTAVYLRALTVMIPSITPVQLAATAAPPAAAAAIMGAAVWLMLAWLPLWVAIALGAAVYAGLVFALGIVDAADRAALAGIRGPVNPGGPTAE